MTVDLLVRRVVEPMYQSLGDPSVLQAVRLLLANGTRVPQAFDQLLLELLLQAALLGDVDRAGAGRDEAASLVANHVGADRNRQHRAVTPLQVDAAIADLPRGQQGRECSTKTCWLAGVSRSLKYPLPTSSSRR